jgi:predicted thioredoxin/glutaredoxin
LTAAPAVARLELLTRAECELCERLLLELDALREREPIPAVTLVDVDADPLLQRRWGLKVPVLLLDGQRVCEQRLDVPELLRLLRL